MDVRGQGGVYFASHVTEWTFDEVGLAEHDFTDEMEDWDVAPIRAKRRARDYHFESAPVPVPILTPTDVRNLGGDPKAKAYEKERKAEAVRQRKADEDAERRTRVNDERNNIRAMQRAAKNAVLAKIESGFEGRAEIHVRKGNQTLRWTYRVENGVAHIDRKVGGWVALSERR